MYHESLEEVNNVRSEYEAKIILANDNYVVAKAENEALKEKVDVLFKLGRSYINNTKKNQNEAIESKDKADGTEEAIEIVEEEPDNLESLQAWTRNKLRGFKRINPSAPPLLAHSQETRAASFPSSSTRENTGPASAPPPPTPTATSATSSQSAPQAPSDLPAPPASRQSEENITDSRYRGKYCHFFVNTGKCLHEERTGEKCKFEHKTAPMCNFGMSCNQPKCMFSHPKMPGNGNPNFLGQMMNGYNPMMNPWQIPNPWMTQQPNNFQNQWNHQGNNTRQY